MCVKCFTFTITLPKTDHTARAENIMHSQQLCTLLRNSLKLKLKPLHRIFSIHSMCLQNLKLYPLHKTFSIQSKFCKGLLLLYFYEVRHWFLTVDAIFIELIPIPDCFHWRRPLGISIGGCTS